MIKNQEITEPQMDSLILGAKLTQLRLRPRRKASPHSLVHAVSSLIKKQGGKIEKVVYFCP